MIVLHAAPITWKEIAGLTVSIPALVASQNRLDGVDAALAVTVANSGRPPEMEFPVFDRKLVLDSVCGSNRAGRLNLPPPFDRPHLVVFHSTYIPAHAAIAARLQKAAIAYVVCPRGGMTRRAQAYRRWRKRVANLLFFNKMVAHAASLHCLTRCEAEQSSSWNRPVFIAGNGVALPAISESSPAMHSRPLRLVFIGRLAIEHKGLDTLLEGCAIARSGLLKQDARVELHGPDWRGDANVLSAKIAELGLKQVVALCGPATGDAKAAVLRQTDVFVHTSRWEGHPMAVLEALAHGIPCLVTPATNVAEEIAAAGAGWTVEPSAEGIAAGIRRILAADRAQLQRAGAAARRLAAENYSWEKIAALSLREYRRCAA